MLGSNCAQFQHFRSIVSTSNRKLRPPELLSSKWLVSPVLRVGRGFETQLKFSNKRWKVSCFQNDDGPSGIPNPEAANDGPSGIPNPEAAEELHHLDSETGETDRTDVGKRNLFTSFKEAIDSLFRVVGKPWSVPWSAETIAQVVLLWIASFWFVGSWMIPVGAHLIGFNKDSLTFRGQALFSLLTDVAEGITGILILHRCLSRFRPLPPDWFKLTLRGNWIVDVLLGCFMFPLVNRLSQFNMDLLPVLPYTPVTLTSVEQSIMARDPVAMCLYALVLVVCAPVWEEVVFRGFLLPSLTKYMPVCLSILVSSIAFALAHFNIQRMLPLIFLGIVMGITYARSRSLLSCMLLHSLWNGFVFLDLMK